MRLVKKFESYTQFDQNFVLAKISQYFSQQQVSEMVSDELKNLLEDTEIDTHRSFNDWYSQWGMGQVEELVCDRIIDWYETHFQQNLTDEQKDIITSKLLVRYNWFN